MLGKGENPTTMVSRMGQERIRLGELLVQSNLIKREQLDEVLAFQKQDGRRLGVLIIERGLVSEFNVTQILSQQLSIPWVALQHIDFSPELLTYVPAELAEKFCAIPIYVRRVRGLGNVLYVAMDDPTNQYAIDDISKQAGMPVRTMIAPPSHIRDALYGFYGVGEPVEESLLAVTPAVVPSLTPAQKTSLSPGGSSSRPPVPTSPDAPNTVDIAKLRLQWNEFHMRVAPGAPALTVKLQNGKLLKLGIAHSEGQYGEVPIAHELVAALSGDGKDRAPDWQTLFGTLIAALVQAGVVVDVKVVKPGELTPPPPATKF